MDAQTKKKNKRSKIGLVVSLAVALLVVAALAFLFAARRTANEADSYSMSSGQGTTATYQVEVKPEAEGEDRAYFKASPELVRAGQRVELEWLVPGAKSVRITGIEGSFGDSGRHILTAFDERVIEATGVEGHASDPDMHAFTMRATMQDGSEHMLTASVKLFH